MTVDRCSTVLERMGAARNREEMSRSRARLQAWGSRYGTATKSASWPSIVGQLAGWARAEARVGERLGELLARGGELHEADLLLEHALRLALVAAVLGATRRQHRRHSHVASLPLSRLSHCPWN